MPDQLQTNQLQDYFVYLVQERGLSGATCRMYFNGMRFLYLQVLHWGEFDIPIIYPKKAQKIPELLTRAEVRQIIQACGNAKHRMMLLTCYGGGLRVSELVALKVRHLDGERGLLRIEQANNDEVDKVLNTLMQKDWVVYSRHCLNHINSIVSYLGRYTHRIAISNRRIIDINKNQVLFSYKDYRDNRSKVMTLHTNEFIRRFLMP